MRRTTQVLLLISATVVVGCSGAEETERAPDGASTSETWTGDVHVSLSTSTGSVGADQPVTVSVTLSNESGNDVRIPRSAAFADGIRAPILDVRRDGVAVTYLGVIARVIASSPSNYITLRGGESVTHSIDVASAYDMSVTGEYTVAYPGDAGPATVLVRAEGRKLQRPDDLDGQDVDLDQAAGIGSTRQAAFVWCDEDQRNAVWASWANARRMVDDANDYLSQTPDELPRYNEWFGHATEYRWGVVAGRFQGIRTGIDNRNVDCRHDSVCREDPSTIAYVYGNQPYKMHLCAPFWGMPDDGANSQADTIVHELSHFVGVVDHVYGLDGARDLAQNDPISARANADNYAYFAANPSGL